MKKILLFLVFLFPLFSLGQVSSCKTERIANATTSFGITIPKGDEIIDLNTGNVYLCTTATAGTYTLTTASGNFTLVSFPGFGFTPTTALSGNYRDSIPRGDSLQYVVADTNARNCFVNKKAGMLVYCNANRSLYILLKDTTITRVRRFMNKPSPHYDTLTLIGCNCSTYRPLGYYPTAKCSGDTTYYHNGWARLYNCWTTYGIWEKISTTDSIPFQYIDNAIIQKVPKDSISFGSSNPQAKLEVDGNIISKGIQWRTISSFIPCGGFGSIWQSIAYGHGIFVAVGYDGGMYSTDGITWTCFPLTGEWANVTYNNGLFVAVNEEGHIAHSSDGVNWSISGYGCIGEAIGVARNI